MDRIIIKARPKKREFSEEKRLKAYKEFMKGVMKNDKVVR